MSNNFLKYIRLVAIQKRKKNVNVFWDLTNIWRKDKFTTFLKVGQNAQIK